MDLDIDEFDLFDDAEDNGFATINVENTDNLLSLDFATNNTKEILNDDQSFSKPKSEYKLNGNLIDYDDHTQIHYVMLRKLKLDPITHMEMSEETAFAFPYQWDPYSGTRLDKDPYGAIYFDPHMLARYFYINRTRNLWVQPTDDNNGYYEGYYNDGVGAGEDFYVAGRGHHPEWYLFRLPVTNCYLTKDHNTQVITFGPKLTNEEIKEINDKLKQTKSVYHRLFRRNPPDLVEMKKLYDLAINTKPTLSNIEDMNQEQIITERHKINRKAVDKLAKMEC